MVFVSLLSAVRVYQLPINPWLHADGSLVGTVFLGPSGPTNWNIMPSPQLLPALRNRNGLVTAAFVDVSFTIPAASSQTNIPVTFSTVPFSPDNLGRLVSHFQTQGTDARTREVNATVGGLAPMSSFLAYTFTVTQFDPVDQEARLPGYPPVPFTSLAGPLYINGRRGEWGRSLSYYAAPVTSSTDGKLFIQAFRSYSSVGLHRVSMNGVAVQGMRRCVSFLFAA